MDCCEVVAPFANVNTCHDEWTIFLESWGILLRFGSNNAISHIAIFQIRLVCVKQTALRRVCFVLFARLDCVPCFTAGMRPALTSWSNLFLWAFIFPLLFGLHQSLRAF